MQYLSYQIGRGSCVISIFNYQFPSPIKHPPSPIIHHTSSIKQHQIHIGKTILEFFCHFILNYFGFDTILN